jgi:hypothetical protein
MRPNDLDISYMVAFGAEHGAKVLKDLIENYAFERNHIFIQGEPDSTSYAIGQAMVINYIRERINAGNEQKSLQAQADNEG